MFHGLMNNPVQCANCNEISLQLTHCIVSSEAQFETWWWPSARAETCSLNNKYYTTLLVVFRPSTLYHLIVVWEYWLPPPIASFHFTSPSVRLRVPSGFKRTLLHPTTPHSLPLTTNNEGTTTSSSRRRTSFSGGKFWPSQRPVSISLDPGRRLSSF